jgi:oligopeptide transport system substrate-binding protein
MFCVLAAIGALAAAGSSLEDPESPVRAPEPPRGSTPLDGETLTMAFARRPRSLDPAFATDRTSANLLLNVMDPLVRLGARLQPVPALVRRWEYLDDGLTIRFTLRQDGRWRNGEPVTADDVVFAWKRVLSPELGSPLAEELFAIEGAAAYHACVRLCTELEDAVGVRTLGRYVFEVRLAFPQPWFVASVSRPAFLPVSRSAVARYGDDWAEPGVIVTDGAFVLAGLTDDGVSLVKNPTWRAAATVDLARVEGFFVPDAVARVQAFDEGRVQALDGAPLPETDLPALAERREFEAYPSLQAWQVALNLTTITDVHQRRAMAAAINRRRVVENLTQRGETPAVRFVTDGLDAAGRTAPPSPWLPEDGDMDAAKAELAEAETVKKEITLLYMDAPGNRDVALALRDAWNSLGLETTVRSGARDTYMDFRGPLGENSVDVYQLDVPLTVPDAGPALDVWTCASPRNKTTFCNGAFDRLIERAREELDPAARSDLYAEADLVLSGTNGQMPGIPLLWPNYTNLESLALQSTFVIDPLGRIDLAAVRIN